MGIPQGHIEQIIKTTHSTSSAAPVAPESKYQKYYNFLWSIEVFPAKTLILGDLGPVVICGAPLTMNGAFSHTEEARALLFPIAHDLLLIGKAPGEEALPVPDAEAINVASAEVSRSFFVATQNGPREAPYFTCLGRRAQKFLDVLNDDKGGERIPRRADS